MGRVKLGQETTIIDIDQKGKSRVTLELVPNNEEADRSIKPVMFKIKCNLKQCIEVTPVYGFLTNHPKSHMRIIEMKYLGDRSKMNDLRLQVCWIEINPDTDWHNQQFTKQQYQDIYKKCQQSSRGQKWFILSFRHSQEDNNIIPQKTKMLKDESVLDKQQIDIKEFRFQSAINQGQRERLATISKKIGENKKLIQLRVILSQQKQQIHQNQKIDWSATNILCFLFFVFLFGVTVGIRLNRIPIN